MRLWWNLAEFVFGGSLGSGGQFYVGALSRNLASAITVLVTSVLVSFSNMVGCLQNRCRVSFWKGNVAVNCITVQGKKKKFHSH
jgi:hypothetical protein